MFVQGAPPLVHATKTLSQGAPPLVPNTFTLPYRILICQIYTLIPGTVPLFRILNRGAVPKFYIFIWGQSNQIKSVPPPFKEKSLNNTRYGQVILLV